MKVSIHPKVILAAIALLVALVGLGFPFASHAYEPIEGIEVKAKISGYGLILPAYSLFFYVLAFSLLFFSRSIKYFTLVLSILNIAFLSYLRVVLLSDETTYPNNLYTASGFYVLIVAAALLLAAGILDLKEKKKSFFGQ